MRAAVELGRRGGSVRSEAKTRAARQNGQRGGRPIRTVSVGLLGQGQITVHAGAVLVGYTVRGLPAFVARTRAAARWLSRHGFESAKWELREVLDAPENWNGRSWAAR